MPSKTFLNLSEEKRNAFIKAALVEFAQYDFQSASISRVVQKLKIAKGSVYQYFQHKKDLYFYLKTVCEDSKKEYLTKMIGDKPSSFWDMYAKMLEAGIRFDLENPLYSRFLFNLSIERAEELGNLLKNHRENSLKMFVTFLTKEREKGRLREDVEVDILAYSLLQTASGITGYLMHKYDIGVIHAEMLDSESFIVDLAEDEISQITQNFVATLQKGMLP